MKKHLGGLYSVTFVDGTTKTGELLEHKVTGGVDHYYVHYVDFDRRLDDWVPADRIDLSAQDLDRHAVAAEVGDAAGSPGRRKRKLEGNVNFRRVSTSTRQPVGQGPIVQS